MTRNTIIHQLRPAILAAALAGAALGVPRVALAVGDATDTPSPIAVVATTDPSRLASPARISPPPDQDNPPPDQDRSSPVSALSPAQIASPAAHLGR